MVYPRMVGIAELMSDNNFVSWVDGQADDVLFHMSAFEIYKLYSSKKII